MPPYSDSLTIVFGLPAFHRLLSRVMMVSIDEKLTSRVIDHQICYAAGNGGNQDRQDVI